MKAIDSKEIDSNVLLIVRNAKELVTVCSKGELLKCGPEQGEVSIIENGSLAIRSGLIAIVGTVGEVDEWAKTLVDTEPNLRVQVLDATGRAVIPGLVDSHTHPVWAGDRVHEFILKLAGATYMEIHEKGGGIGFTVGHTRNSSKEDLKVLLRERLSRMTRSGTTVVECKSGYGLNLETELKLLQVLHEMKAETDIDLVSTYLGAHSVPKGSTAEEATEDIVTNHIPEIKKQMDAGTISPTLIDVFCENKVFTIDQTRRILQAGKAIGLESNFHGDELTPMKAAELCGEIGVLAMSHCEEVSDDGIKAMSLRPTFATLLPTTAYLLHLKYPPARKLIQGNVPVALATDFNPNAHCLSMPFVMNLACVNMGMTLKESLVASTINSAASIGLAKQCGSLEEGKWADLVLLSPGLAWEHLIYEMIDPPISMVIKKGKVVFTAEK